MKIPPKNDRLFFELQKDAMARHLRSVARALWPQLPVKFEKGIRVIRISNRRRQINVLTEAIRYIFVKNA